MSKLNYFQNRAKFLFQFNFRHLFDSDSKVNLFFGGSLDSLLLRPSPSQKGDLRSDLRLVKSFTTGPPQGPGPVGSLGPYVLPTTPSPRSKAQDEILAGPLLLALGSQNGV